MAAEKPTLIVSGNCQARVIWQSLVESPQVLDRYRPVYVRNFRKGDQGEARIEDLERCAVLLEQIAHKAPEMPNKQALPADCKVIRYPILWLGSLWPLHIDDPRNRPSEQYPAGPFPYGDRLMLDLLDQGLGPDEAVRRWLDADVPALVDLDRLHEILEAKAAALDRRAEIPFGDYVRQGFRSRRLFVTRNHFSEPMLKHVRDVVFSELGLEPPPGALTGAMRGMGDIETPVHPSVAAHFGLEWWSPQMTWLYHGERIGAAEYQRRYAELGSVPVASGAASSS